MKELLLTPRMKRVLELWQKCQKETPEKSKHQFMQENKISCGTFYLALQRSGKEEKKDIKRNKKAITPKPTYQVLEAKEVAEVDKLTVVIGTISSIKKLINL